MAMATENSVEMLEALLRDASPQVRCNAAEALIRVEGEQGIPKLLFLLEDSEPLVRWFVSGILYSWGNASFLERFMDSALHDEDANVRSVAILGLGKFGTLETIPLLEEIRTKDTGVDDYDWKLSDVALYEIASLRQNHT
jgi:HEAT repeat protein